MSNKASEMEVAPQKREVRVRNEDPTGVWEEQPRP